VSHGDVIAPRNRTTPPPTCRLGGICDLVSREWVYGYSQRYSAGIAQCLRCSVVYEPVAWQPRACGECGLFYGESLHDPCLGEIPGVIAACCGHGEPSERYGVPDDWPVRR